MIEVPRWLSVANDVLRPLGEAVRGLADADLRSLVKVAAKARPTNCPATVYEGRALLATQARIEIERRETGARR